MTFTILSWVAIFFISYLSMRYYVLSKQSIQMFETAKLDEPGHHHNSIAIIIAVYEEDKIAKDMVEYYRNISQSLDIPTYFVSTRREGSVKHNLTHTTIARLIKNESLLHILHYPGKGTKAAQINYVTNKIKNTIDYYAVFDADSRPDSNGLRYALTVTGSPDVMQMPSQYSVGLRTASKSQKAATVFQTRWTLCYEVPRWKLWSAQQQPKESVTYLVGHGLFLKPSVTLPEDTITEDIELGYRMSRERNSFQIIPYYDYCTVPPSAGSLIVQSSRWFHGELALCKRLLSLLVHKELSLSYKLRALIRCLHVSMWPLGVPLYLLTFFWSIYTTNPWLLVATLLSGFLYVYMVHAPTARDLGISINRISPQLFLRCLINFVGPMICIARETFGAIFTRPMTYKKTARQ